MEKINLEQALEHFGSQKRLADILGVKQQTVSKWLQFGVPAENLSRIYTELRAYNICVAPHLMRPDLYVDYKHISELTCSV